MIRLSKTLALAYMCLLGVCIGMPAFSQKSPTPVAMDMSTDAYKNLLNAIFPPPERNVDGLCQFVLRFTPTRHPESELIILVHRDGTGQATLYSVAESSAWTISNNYARKTGSDDVREIAKLIHIKKLIMVIPSDQMTSIRSGLSMAMADTVDKLRRDAAKVQEGGSYTMVIDGSIYDLAFDQVGTSLTWNFDDLEVEDPENTFMWPLVRWMNHLRTYVLGKATDK